MEVQGGVQQLEPRPLGSPRPGPSQQHEADDRQTDRPSADSHGKDAQPASQKDDKKVSALAYLCTSAAAVLGVCVE